MNEAIKLFIVEGVEKDYRFVKGMTDLFMRGRFAAKIIYLPAAQNIYMLYKKLVEDDFQTDIVEVLRESSDAAREILEGMLVHMLETFDNETDNGKLYISYPMVEALYDYRDNQCQAFYKCLITDEDIRNYKNKAGNNNPSANFHNDIHSWEMILYSFGLRMKCLFDLDSVDYKVYRERMSVSDIYLRQTDLRQQYNATFVLSGLSEFLFDYFGERFWHRYWRGTAYHFDHCQRKRR